MEPASGQRGGFLGGLLGGVVGGLAWLVISGIVLRDPLVWAPPIALGIGLWWGAMLVYNHRPERAFTILGVVFLSLIIISSLYLDPVFARLPERVWGAPTGKSAFAILQVKILLGLLAAMAVGFIARDLLSER